MELKKSAKMRKYNILLDVLSPKSNSKLIFRIFVNFLAHFEEEVGKNVFLVILSKKVSFLSKFDITNVLLVKFPF